MRQRLALSFKTTAVIVVYLVGNIAWKCPSQERSGIQDGNQVLSDAEPLD